MGPSRQRQRGSAKRAAAPRRCRGKWAENGVAGPTQVSVLFLFIYLFSFSNSPLFSHAKFKSDCDWFLNIQIICSIQRSQYEFIYVLLSYAYI
jgi:hypothetical protein